MPKEKKDEIQVEARLTVWDPTSSDPRSVITVRKFEKAWVMAKDLANLGCMPVRIRLDGFVRKDNPKDEFVIRL